LNRKLLNKVLIFEGVSGVLSLTGLYHFWYADYPQSSFHFFDDKNEWLQMDKFGHATTSYQMGKIGYELLRLPGVEKRRALWYGGTLGFGYLSLVEMFDGFSQKWGYSPYDMLANAVGTALFMGQQFGWDEQRVTLKFSYFISKYASYRPQVLGRSFYESVLKDYNGQTYWLSVNISSLLPKTTHFPKFLNVALGYSVDGVLGGSNNITAYSQNQYLFERTRQYLFSLDIDLTRIPTNSKTLKMIFHAVNLIKIPFPALEYNSGEKWKFHYLYF
jgi:hypothetical protein